MVISECGIQKDTIPQKSAYLLESIISFNIISEKAFFGKNVICGDPIVLQRIIIGKNERKCD